MNQIIFFIENSQNLFYILLVLIMLIIILLILIIRLSIKTKKLLRGKNAKSLEDSFIKTQDDLNNLQRSENEIKKYLKSVEKRLKTSLRGFDSVDFDAFSGMASGGKSFATAFINENGDGIILSCLNARDHIRIFSKKIKNFQSEIKLSDEEQSALTKAKESCSL